MPELPEVETIKNQLSHRIIGKKIKAIDIRLPKMIQGVSMANFKKIINGSKIKSIDRRAKLLIINLSNNYSLLIHLKLSGQIIFKLKINPPTGGEKLKIDKHTHLIYHFTDNSILLHNDMRQFGWVKLIKTEKLSDYFFQEKFGPEPLGKDFTLEKFKELLFKKQNQQIKPLLMDQKFIAGVGNIYAQESCFCAKILPTRRVATLKEKEVVDLYRCLIKILKEAIAHHGSSVDAYVDSAGKKGKHVPYLRVYDREGKKCHLCPGSVEKIALKGRGTYFCQSCQK